MDYLLRYIVVFLFMYCNTYSTLLLLQNGKINSSHDTSLSLIITEEEVESSEDKIDVSKISFNVVEEDIIHSNLYAFNSPISIAYSYLQLHQHFKCLYCVDIHVPPDLV